MSADELLAQKREVEQKVFDLRKYFSEFQRIYGEINALTYRQNTLREKGELLSKNDQQRKADLIIERRITTAAFRKDYPSVTCSLRGIREKVASYEMVLTRIDLQQQNRERLEYLEGKLTDRGIDLLVQQASQEPAPRYDSTYSPGERV